MARTMILTGFILMLMALADAQAGANMTNSTRTYTDIPRTVTTNSMSAESRQTSEASEMMSPSPTQTSTEYAGMPNGATAEPTKPWEARGTTSLAQSSRNSPVTPLTDTAVMTESATAVPTRTPEKSNTTSLPRSSTNAVTNSPMETQPLTEMLPSVPTAGPEKCPDQCICDMVRHTVSCSNEGLASIPVGIPSRTWYLSLNGNHFEKLPEDIFADLPNLVSLQLVQCGISSIQPLAFRGLSQLRHLDMRSNMLRDIHNDTFSQLMALTELNLQNNKIEDIHSFAFAGMSLLNKVSLDGNPLSHFQEDLFSDNKYLEELSLRYCRFDDVSSLATAGSWNITHLDLSGNAITTLDADSFRMLPSLSSLHLANMFPKLTTINEDAFHGLANLGILDISDNALEVFGVGHVMRLTLLEVLSLKNNPWNCNCPMGELLIWLRETSVDYYDTLWKCNSPPELEGQIVFTILSVEKFACQPYFSKPPVNATIVFGSSAVFRIDVRGDPNPILEWYLPNGNLIRSNHGEGQHAYVEAGGAIMVIQKAQDSHNGTFSVTAMNMRGSVTVYFDVTVTGMQITEKPTTMEPQETTTTGGNEIMSTIPPPCVYAPIQVRVTDIRDTSATLVWTPYNSEDLLSYIIHQTEFGNPESYQTTLTDASKTSQRVQSLRANSNFILCVTVYLQECPSFASLDQCVQISTKGGPGAGGAGSLEVQHRNELIILAVASVAATLLLVGSIFLITWKFNQPKSLRRYEFQANEDTIRFAGLEPVDMTRMHRAISATSQQRNENNFTYDSPTVMAAQANEPEYEMPKEYPLTTFNVEVHKQPLPPDDIDSKKVNDFNGRLSNGFLSADGHPGLDHTLGCTLDDDAGMATLISELRFQQDAADSESDNEYNYLS